MPRDLIFLCMTCPFCGAMTDLVVPRDTAIGDAIEMTAQPGSVLVPGSQAHRNWSRLAELLGMPVAELAERASHEALLPLVIAKLEGRR